MPKSQEIKLNKIRHSLAHIMATAVEQLYPGVKFGIGPAIANGFYYDFDFSGVLPLGRDKTASSHLKTCPQLEPRLDFQSLPKGRTPNDALKSLPQNKISPEDLPKIEEKMRQLIKKNLLFEKKLLSESETKKLFADQPYKLELIRDLKKKAGSAKKMFHVSCFMFHDFTDLCKGPHVKSTKEINPKAFKLTKIAGAYWRGSEKNPMLTRIYGLAFTTEKELQDYLKKQEEIEKRDHRVLGQKLDLFSISEEVGAGLIIWHPKGAILHQIIQDFWEREHQKRGYQPVITPHIGRLELWQKSGHTEFYKENMYPAMKIEDEMYQLKPMNCPFHVQVYKSKIRSYRELPLKYSEWGTVYRYERSGTLHGLMRVRGFTQDDAHIFCTSEQLGKEILAVLDLALFMLKAFGFDKYEVDLSLRDPKNKEKYLGEEKSWQKAEKALEYALKQKKIKYTRVEGEAVFYGPKIDIKLVDALGRAWQGPTIQVDFNFPEKFDLNFINEKGKKERGVMVHHTVLGSICRFIGVLLEHYAGALPLWLAPEQIWIVPVGKKHQKYAQEIIARLANDFSAVSPGLTISELTSSRNELFGTSSSKTQIKNSEQSEPAAQPSSEQNSSLRLKPALDHDRVSGPQSLRVKLINTNETVAKKIREAQLQKIPYVLVVGDKEISTKTVAVRHRQRGDMGIMSLDEFLKNVKIESGQF